MIVEGKSASKFFQRLAPTNEALLRLGDSLVGEFPLSLFRGLNGLLGVLLLLLLFILLENGHEVVVPLNYSLVLHLHLT